MDIAHAQQFLRENDNAVKVRNLRHDPRATLCVFVEAFRGPWVQIEGTAEIVTLPDAMEPLADYYRRLSGEHPDWDDYRRARLGPRGHSITQDISQCPDMRYMERPVFPWRKRSLRACCGRCNAPPVPL
jgi:hypothetical protein